MFFRRPESYDREQCLKAASKAVDRGKFKKAIFEYMRVLDAYPEDHAVHLKLAPLLAKTKRLEESWNSFKIAANGYSSTGFSQKAIGVYSHAAQFMPKNPEVWEAIFYIYIQQDKKADAVQILYKGHRHFREKPYRETAIKFLRKAFSIEPWNFEVTFELARLVKKVDIVEALGLLEGLAGRVKGTRLAKVRAAIFFMQPGLSTGWRWLKTVLIKT